MFSAHLDRFKTVRRRAAVAVGAVAAVASLLLAGCSSGGGAGGTSQATGGDVHLTFLNQSRGQEAALNYLADEYKKQTGVTVTINSPGPADYVPKLQAMAQSKQMPDIYSSFSPTVMAPFYKAGWAMDLTSELAGDWGKDFSPSIVKLATFGQGNNLGVKPGIYSVHWETQSYGFLVDPKSTGIDPANPPKTSQDLVSALAAGKKDGQGDFSVAASLTPQLVQYAASNWLTDEQVNDTFGGKYSWTSDGWRKAFQFLLDLKNAGVIANNALAGGQGDNPAVEGSFFTKHSVGSIFDASPGISVGYTTAPEYTSYGSLSMPRSSDAQTAPRSPGVPGKGAVINPKGQNVQAALAFVKWLTAPAQQQMFVDKAHIIPTNPSLLSGGKLSSQLTGFAAAVNDMQVIPNSMTAPVTDAITRDSQRLVLGQMSVDEVLADVQNAQNSSQQ